MKMYTKILTLAFLKINICFSSFLSERLNEFVRYLPENPVVLEAGAHKGDDTLQMRALLSNPTIYAFEPIPKLFNALKEATTPYANIQCFCCALSDTTGRAKMYVSSGYQNGYEFDSSSSLLVPKDHLQIYPQVTFNQTIEVKTITLDEWAIENDIDHIDLCWLDMQGYEPAVLMASKNMIETIKVIFTEINISEVYKDNIRYRDFKKWLEEHGFVLVKEFVRNRY